MFSRSLRSLSRPGPRASVLTASAALVLLVAWLLWFLRADIPLYEVSTRARFEVDRAAAPVQSPVAGRVAESRLSLGASVRAGDVIVVLDTAVVAGEIAGERANLAAVVPQLTALDREIAAREAVVHELARTESATVDEARARQRAPEASARYASEEADRIAQLSKAGKNKSVTELEVLRLTAEAERRHAEADAARLAVQRLLQESRERAGEQRAALAGLARQRAQLEARSAQVTAALTQLDQQMELRHVRAPISGRLGEVMPLRPGTFVHEGDRIATVVPAGALRVVAEFAPSAAVGRVSAGQHARVRLDGFPWTEYGTLPARVTTVGSEVREGSVRVELAVQRGVSRIPAQHGMPGAVEIEVEHVTPMALLLRTAGRWSSPSDPSLHVVVASPQ